MPSLRYLFSRIRCDNGNALLGFLAVSPVVGLLLVSVLEMACVVWTRELVAEHVRVAVADAAHSGGSATIQQKELAQKLVDEGIQLISMRWSQESVGGGEQLLSATVEVRPPGVALLPALTTTVSATAIKE